MGTDYAVLHAAIKRFPVNASQHSPIELLEKLVQENSIRPEDVKKIAVGVNEGVILHSGSIYEPHEVIEAQFSLRFSLALRLLKRSNNIEFYFDPQVWRDTKLLEIGKKIELFSDPTATRERRFACNLKLTLNNGKVMGGQLSSPKGTSKNPLSREEVQNKFLELGSKVLPEQKLMKIVEKVDQWELEDDVASIVPMLRSEKDA
jgi:2-methylcitrate dehydratase PrpD